MKPVPIATFLLSEKRLGVSDSVTFETHPPPQKMCPNVKMDMNFHTILYRNQSVPDQYFVLTMLPISLDLMQGHKDKGAYSLVINLRALASGKTCKS